eukprot:Awhi_evm1s2025
MDIFCVATLNLDLNTRERISDEWCQKMCLNGEEKDYCSYNDTDKTSLIYFNALNPNDSRYKTGPCRTSDGSKGKDGIEFFTFAGKNIDECRQMCIENNHCLAFEAKVDPNNHYRCEIWYVLPVYAKSNADTYTCQIKLEPTNPLCDCYESPDINYACESLEQSVTNEKCQEVCTDNYNHDLCLYAGFFPQSNKQACSCVTNTHCAVPVTKLNDDDLCDGSSYRNRVIVSC